MLGIKRKIHTYFQLRYFSHNNLRAAQSVSVPSAPENLYRAPSLNNQERKGSNEPDEKNKRQEGIEDRTKTEEEGEVVYQGNFGIVD
jgi:hypothetical protein